MQLQDASVSPNAQLRALNPHVGGALRSNVECGLPTQVTQKASRTTHMGGVSSFGYSGTIAHAVLAFGSGEELAFGCKLDPPSALAFGSGEALPFCRDPDPLSALAIDSRGAEAPCGGVSAKCSRTEGGRSTFERCSMPRLLYRRRALPWRDPPHPFTQRSLALSDSSIIFRSPAAGPFHMLFTSHVVHGRAIFPGAGYLEMARAAAATALHGVYFLQPLAVEASGLLIECTVSAGRLEVRSGEDGAFKDGMVHCSGALATANDWQRVDHPPLRSPSRAFDVAALYDGFDAVGLQYGPGYRTLMQAWGGVSDALARLRALVR